MNIGAGLAAADGFFQGQEHLQDRDYLAKQRAYEQARMQAGLDTMPDQVAADKARLGLATDTARAGQTTLPGQTANVVAQQGLDAGSLKFKGTQQPVEQANQAKVTQVQGAGLDSAIAQIPETETVRVAGNGAAASARHTQALVDLGRYLGANDKAGAIAHINKVADAESVQAGTKGKKFTDIKLSGEKPAKEGDADTRAFHLVAEDGSDIPIPYAAVQQAQALAKTGKYSMHEGRAGDVHVLNEATGDLQTKVPADPNYVRTAGSNQHTPAQLQLVNAYMAAPENKGMTFSQAMEKVKTSMEKPRHQAILDLVGKNLLPGADPQKEYDKWARMYDVAKGSAPGLSAVPNPMSPGAPSNSPPGFTINPKIQSLFTP